MPKYERLELWSDFQAAGGVPLLDVPDPLELRATFNVEAPDQESLTFATAITSPAAASLTARRVARVVHTDGTFLEWKIAKDGATPLAEPGRLTVTAQPPIFALVECGLYYTTGAGGVRSFAFSLQDVTPSAAFAALVLGAPDCPSWIGAGTFDPSVLISIAGEFSTPLAIAFAIRDAIRAAGIGCEIRCRANGTTQYLVDFVTAIGASAATPEIRVGKQLLGYVHEHDTARQATRIIPRGPVDATGVDATLARARFIVSAVDSGTSRLMVADEAGGGGPIAYDEQWVGAFVYREKTGRTFQIVHTYAATQEIELATLSDFAVHSVTVPEWISFRLTEALNGTRRVGQPSTIGAPFVVTTVVGGTKKLTLANQYGVVSPTDPVSGDGEHVDWQAARATLVRQTTASALAAGVQTCASVVGVLAGDICIVSYTGLPTATLAQVVATVVSVGAGTVNLTPRYGGTLSDWSGSSRYCDFYRPVATLHRITASAAGANTITVDAVGTAAATDIIESITQVCQGTFPYYVESPTDVASYGKKIAVLNRGETGEVDLVPNSCTRLWTGSTPDGFTFAISSGAPAQAKETTITRQGGASWYIELAGTSGTATAKTPPARVHPIVGAESISVRLKVQFPAAALSGEQQCFFTVQKVDAGGNVLYTADVWNNRNILAVGGPNNTTLPDAQLVAVDEWVDIAFEGLDISTFVNSLLRVDITGSAPTGILALYFDGVQITQTPTAPRVEPALLIEYAEPTRLLQAGNLELVAWASPPIMFSLTAADLEAIDPTLFAEDKITLGGTMRAINPDAAVDLSLRLMQWSPDYLDPAGATYVLATLPALLSARLAGGGSTGGAGTITASASAIGGGAVAWAAVVGKPATFPADPHVHRWPDIVDLTGDGPHLGLVNFKSSGTTVIDMGTGLPAATVIALITGTTSLHVVFGTDTAGNSFVDLLVGSIQGGAGNGGAILLSDAEGTPRARTWTYAAGNLQLALGGAVGTTYHMRVLTFEGHA